MTIPWEVMASFFCIFLMGKDTPWRHLWLSDCLDSSANTFWATPEWPSAFSGKQAQIICLLHWCASIFVALWTCRWGAWCGRTADGRFPTFVFAIWIFRKSIFTEILPHVCLCLLLFIIVHWRRWFSGWRCKAFGCSVSFWGRRWGVCIWRWCRWSGWERRWRRGGLSCDDNLIIIDRIAQTIWNK